mgnify:CR=1 FL=1
MSSSPVVPLLPRLVGARLLDAPMAALAWLLLERGVPVIVAGREAAVPDALLDALAGRVFDSDVLGALAEALQLSVDGLEPLLRTPEGYRGDPHVDRETCVGCTACANVCPADAIEILDGEGRRVVRFRREACVFCGTCQDVCPTESVTLRAGDPSWYRVKGASTSEAALPLALENMERFGVPKYIVAFVIPTGYSFNLDGTTLYLSLASVFVAQAAGVQLSIGQQLMIEIDHAQGNQCPGKRHGRGGLPTPAEMPGNQGRQHAAQHLDQRVAGADRFAAGRTGALQHEITQNRDILQRSDGMTAVRAA